MIGLDTNVVLRYLVRDDERAFQVAAELIRSTISSGDSLIVSVPVLLECEWVLRSRYGYAKAQRIAVFTSLLSCREVYFDDEAMVEFALRHWQRTSADFADCLIVASYLKMGCRPVVTFDKKAAALPETRLLRC